MKNPLIRSISAALVLTAFSSAPLAAATMDELVAGIRVELEKAITEGKNAKGGAASSNAYDLERQLSRLDTAAAKENFPEIEQVLNQLALTRLSVEAKEKISQLQREMPKIIEEREKAFAAQVAASIEKAGKACLSAKTESDLDPIVAELGALKRQRAESSSGFSESRQRINTRLEGATRFVTRWQDYLVQVARGFDGTARTILRELADPGTSAYYPILSRAEITAKLGKDQDVLADDVIRQVKTLDEIPKAVAELTRLSRENSGRVSGFQEFTAPLNELNQLARAHAAFKAGNYGSAMMTAAQWEGTGGLKSPESMRLKTMLVLEVIPRYLELPDDPKPNEGENPSEFLLRLAGESAAKGDWARVARALDAYRVTGFGYRVAPGWIPPEIEACQQFVAGQNLEKAGRFAPAILAYQRAVKVTGKYSPQKAATERLAALEKEQPAAFTEAGKEPQIRELLDAIRASSTLRGVPAGGTLIE